MRTPNNSLWLVALAAALAFTSGNRALDYIGISVLAGHSSLWDAGALIGAASMPFLAVPFMVGAAAILVAIYPSTSIPLFQWSGKAKFRQTFWSLFFCILAIPSVGFGSGFVFGIPALFEQGHKEFVLDAVFNSVACFGGLYFWLCFRAIVCYVAPEKTVILSGEDPELLAPLTGSLRQPDHLQPNLSQSQ